MRICRMLIMIYCIYIYIIVDPEECLGRDRSLYTECEGVLETESEI